jgi:hypothetical protein
MEQMIRRCAALLSAVALVAGAGWAARSTEPRDKKGGGNNGSNICVIAGDIVFCAPPNDSPG